MATSKKEETVVPSNYTEKEPSELVIKEVMVQKNITKEEAIKLLKNPSN